MNFCANPDCGNRTEQPVYCSGYCQREARRIHGPILHMSQIDYVMKQALTNIVEFGSKIGLDETTALTTIKEIHRSLAIKAGTHPFAKDTPNQPYANGEKK